MSALPCIHSVNSETMNLRTRGLDKCQAGVLNSLYDNGWYPTRLQNDTCKYAGPLDSSLNSKYAFSPPFRGLGSRESTVEAWIDTNII